MQDSTQKQLRQFVEQLERLEEERLATVADIKDKFAEIKAVGFDIKIVKKVLALRKKDPSEIDEEEALIATYMQAVQGVFDFGGDRRHTEESPSLARV